jgi:hypothetical protein
LPAEHQDSPTPERASLARPLLWATLVMGPAGILLIILLLWTAYSDGWFSLLLILGMGVVFAAVLVGLILLGAATVICYGITIDDAGVTVEERTLVPGKRVRSHVAWKEMRDPSVRMGVVTIKTDNPFTWMSLSYEQGKAVLGDPRCPLFGKVPGPIHKRIGLLPPS